MELKLTQYLRPYGRKKILQFDVPEETVKMAEGMILSCEVLQTGQVAVYVQHPETRMENRLAGIADNSPGENSPARVLCELIKKVYESK